MKNPSENLVNLGGGVLITVFFDSKSGKSLKFMFVDVQKPDFFPGACGAGCIFSAPAAPTSRLSETTSTELFSQQEAGFVKAGATHM